MSKDDQAAADADSQREEKPIGKVVDSSLMRRLLRYVWPYRGMASLATVLILLSSALQLVGPLLTAITLDLFVKPLDGAGDAEPVSLWFGARLADLGVEVSAVEGVVLMAVLYVLALLAAFVVTYVQNFVMGVMGQHIMYDLRRDIFAHLQALPVAYFDKNPLGRLVTRATTDVGSLAEVFTSGLVSILGDVLLLVGIIMVLFMLDWRLALVAFAIVPLLFALTVWFKTNARRAYRKVRIQVARINSFLQEHITGMPVVQLFNREGKTKEDFAERSSAHRDAHVQSIFYYAVYYPTVELITALGLGLLVWYGGGRVLAGYVSVGALIAFIQYTQRFYRPLANLSEQYNVLQSALASGERIFDLLDTEATIVSPEDAYRPETVDGRIEFDHVGFAYNVDEPVLHDVSFEIQPGEMVAVVGHTGAGKSTLANLMLRFYDVTKGGVRIDDIDVRDWDLERLRSRVAMVQQDVFLFSGTIADNIRLGADHIDDERVRWAAREVDALDFIERLPDGFQTMLRERGAGLSVGQKQLIVFARALAFSPRILILDEATASVDSETEARIQHALDRLLVGRTSIVIAHRLSTIQRADRILVMHKGCLREQGTHQQLLAQRGIYRTLYELQFQEPVAVAS
ncbi:MAG: ABC transporter ATP-binding protein [Acidobacteriota bacterium]